LLRAELPSGLRFVALSVAHELYGSALVSVGSELGLPVVVQRPFAGRRTPAGLLRTSSASTFRDPKLWNLVAFAERPGVLAERALRRCGKTALRDFYLQC
jgi:hypothetical protein